VRYASDFSGRGDMYSLFLNANKVLIQFAPDSIRRCSALSSVTTVHVQHPKRLFPHEGVLLSITSGHSPWFDPLYNSSNSWFDPPQGHGALIRYIQTSSADQLSIGM